MDGELNKWRQERMQALAEKLGGKAVLGRMLGYRDGAYVGQMISGMRPITEKTILAAERLRSPTGESLKGWFTSGASMPTALVAREPGAVFEAPTAEELELLDNFRHMLDHDREELAAEIAMRAARAKADIDKYIQRMGLTPRPASASAKVAADKARATVPPSQRSLDLDPSSRRKAGAK